MPRAAHVAPPWAAVRLLRQSTTCRHDHRGHGDGTSGGSNSGSRNGSGGPAAPPPAADGGTAELGTGPAAAPLDAASHTGHGSHGEGGHEHGPHGGAAHQIQHRAVEKVSFKVLEKVRPGLGLFVSIRVVQCRMLVARIVVSRPSATCANRPPFVHRSWLST
jgi:hypothetical protein